MLLRGTIVDNFFVIMVDFVDELEIMLIKAGCLRMFALNSRKISRKNLTIQDIEVK